MGPSVTYDPKQRRVIFNTDEYKDSSAKIIGTYNQKEKEKIEVELMKNALNVLMKRGIKGLYIYAYDDELNKILKQAFSKSVKKI